MAPDEYECDACDSRWEIRATGTSPQVVECCPGCGEDLYTTDHYDGDEADDG